MRVNPDTCFSVPVSKIQLSEHPVTLAELNTALEPIIPEHIDDVISEFSRQFPADQEMTETQRDTLRKLHTLVLALQNPQTSQMMKMEIGLTIHERIRHCFGGFFNGINSLIDKLQTPEEFSDYLYHIRKDFIENIARQHTGDVHGVNRFLTIAHAQIFNIQGQEIRGFGIKPLNSDDPYSGGFSEAKVLRILNAHLREFNVPMLVNELLKRVHQDILARVEKNALGCILPDALDTFFQKFFANHPIVQRYLQAEKTTPPSAEQISAYDEYLQAFYILDENELPTDINWPIIQWMLVQEMQSQNLFLLSAEDVAILDFLYNPSSTIDGEQVIQINSYEDVKHFFSFQGVVKRPCLLEKAKPFIREKIAQGNIAQSEFKFLLGVLEAYPDLLPDYHRAFLNQIRTTESLDMLMALLRALNEYPRLDENIGLRREILTRFIQHGKLPANYMLEFYQALPDVLKQELVDFWSADNLLTLTRLLTGFLTQIYLFGIPEIGPSFRLDFLQKVESFWFFQGVGIDFLNGLKPVHQEQMLRYIAHDIRFFFGWSFYNMDHFHPEHFLIFFQSIPDAVKEMVLYDFIQNDILRKYITAGRPRNLLGKFFESYHVGHRMMIEFYAALPPDLRHRVLQDCHQYHKKQAISLDNLYDLLRLFDSEADKNLILQSFEQHFIFGGHAQRVFRSAGDEESFKNILDILNIEQKEKFLINNDQKIVQWIGNNPVLFVELVTSLPIELRHYVVLKNYPFDKTSMMDAFIQEWMTTHAISEDQLKGKPPEDFISLYYRINQFKLHKQKNGRLGSAQTMFDCMSHTRQIDAASLLMEKMLNPEMELSPEVIGILSQGPLAQLYQEYQPLLPQPSAVARL
jgi:hypothetical protein